jgi:PAS domain S-box-containing protein
MGALASRQSVARSAGFALVIATAYVAAALIGFRVAFVAQQVTTVWAPTGIAVAVLLLRGTRWWPVIWVAAFVANATTSAPLWTAAVIATGNTGEAMLAAWALDRSTRFDPSLHRVRDVVAFIIVAVGAATIVSATTGAATLCVAGLQPWSRFAVVWFDWWLGDAMGALIVAPAILTVARAEPSAVRALPAAMLIVGALFATELVFGHTLGARSTHPLEYIVFPFVVAAAVRGGPPITSLLVFSVSIVTIVGTVQGSGPFATGDIHQSLILLQAFMGVLAGTGLLLASAMVERETSRRREMEAAAEVRRREEVLRLAQRAGGVAVFEWDFANQIARCSAEFFEIFGLPPRDGIMASADWGRYVHPDDRGRMTAHLAAVLEGREAAAADYRICTEDGRTRWLAYSGQLQTTPAGRRLLGTVTDVTSRVEAEAALRDAKDAAEAANRLKDQFLATLSHELRTPLNVILGYARMLQRDVVPPDQRARAIDVIARNAIAQNELVDDLLDMSRITTGKLRLDAHPVAPAAVLLEAIEGIRPALEAKDICLQSEIDPDAGDVKGDASRLHQIYWNLLINAVKSTGRGGRVAVRITGNGSHVETTIEDTGIGIDGGFLPFVFEPFRQADARLNREHGGLGLGLAIAKELVELHGGTIHAASDGAGRGATFTVRLPRSSG